MKIYRFLFLMPCVAVFSGCVDLSYRETFIKDKSYVFGSRTRGVKELVTNVYSYLNYDFGQMYEGAMLASATDESEYAWSTSSVKTFYNGAWSALNHNSDAWKHNYEGIRAANYFLENGVNLTFDEFKYNTDYDSWMREYSLYPYEVRFLRAYFYFELLKHYGGVPLITSTLTDDEANNVGRNSVSEVVEFITKECDEIRPYLPVSFESTEQKETGRITKAAVLALKARTLLYAASPLFNPENNIDLYHQAAMANKNLIDSCAVWNIFLGLYPALWGDNSFTNREIILGRRVAQTNQFEQYNFPVGVEGGRSGNCPTQTLVDNYELKSTGKTWDEVGSGYDPTNPYNDRDPRFGFTIIKNGDTNWPSYNANGIETFLGGINGLPKLGATTTGYYLKKYCDQSIDLRPNSSNQKRHTWIIFRLGEFYLNYAEALFMWSESSSYKDDFFTMSPIEAVNKTRSRPGVEMPPITAEHDFLKKLRRERMVELAFENHRFWDVRRWKIGAENFSKITRMELTKDNGIITYNRIIKPRVWQDKMNFFPVPDTELRKNRKLTQNQGW